MKIKNKLHLLPFFLIGYLGLFFLININPVMAMDHNNKDKQIKNYTEVSETELNNFFQLLNRSKKNISEIREKIPHLKNASIKEIEQWACSSDTQQTKNKRLKTIDFDLNQHPKN
ncbi:hypothetical protein B2G44_00345 [Candidatus Phytoplasma citri]|uniref:Sequence-variable mosaic (SVM) signal sequence domain-containing protein n=2 Tax=16SrII (Peanut WB group) TaxID=85621 RepID=A0A1S9M4T4_9MOLU|nr:hypothetical protein B2G44_00345 [Candidatus Phytoplasma aurantifolia]